MVFHGCLMVKIPGFYARGVGFIPDHGTKIPHDVWSNK